MAAKFSASLTHDSDEINEMFCEECEKHGDGYATAVAFCVNCVEYKCKKCQRYHRRQFQSHKIQDSDHMPQDFYFENCSVHPKQLIKFYCSKCNKEACQGCKDNEHVNCRDVNHLPSLASDIQNSDELKVLRNHMEQLSEDIKETEKMLKDKSEVIDKQEKKVTEARTMHRERLIANFKQQHKDLIDNFDMNMERTIARLKKERADLVQRLSEKERKFEDKIWKAENNMKKEVVNTNTNFKLLKSEHIYLVDSLKAITIDLTQAQTLSQNCKLFIKLKYAKQLCKSLQQSIEKMRDADIERYELKISDVQPTMHNLENKTIFSLEKIHASAVDRRNTFFENIRSIFAFTQNHTGHSFRRSGGSTGAAMEISSQKRWKNMAVG